MDSHEEDTFGRLNEAPEYPKSVYLSSLLLFFGANFMFHQNCFRKTGSRPQFAAFMFVNAFTSYQVSEMSNMGYLYREAIVFNNTREMNHRTEMNDLIRAKMLGVRMI